MINADSRLRYRQARFASRRRGAIRAVLPDEKVDRVIVRTDRIMSRLDGVNVLQRRSGEQYLIGSRARYAVAC